MQSLLVVSALSSATAVLAQNVGLNSPHNYKRPVFQQNQNAQSGVSVQRGQFQNNIGSVHNYKRQKTGVNMASESSLVLNVPLLPPPTLNPLLSPGHYKVHFKSFDAVQELAQRNKPRSSAAKIDSTK